jgi:hypothetical protein
VKGQDYPGNRSPGKLRHRWTSYTNIPALTRRVIVHDLPHPVDTGIEYAYTAHIAPVSDRADNGEDTLIAKGEVPPGMFPDYRFDTVFVPVGPAFRITTQYSLACAILCRI